MISHVCFMLNNKEREESGEDLAKLNHQKLIIASYPPPPPPKEEKEKEKGKFIHVYLSYR